VTKKIQEYLLTELDLETGNFNAQVLVEFLSDHLGYNYYNQGLKDALTLIEGKVEKFYRINLSV
jgi:uncharacterized protein (DUF2164 family)